MATDRKEYAENLIAVLERARVRLSLHAEAPTDIADIVRAAHEDGQRDLAIVNLIDLLQEVAMTPTHRYDFNPTNTRN